MRRTARTGRCTESRSEGRGGGTRSGLVEPASPPAPRPRSRQEAAGEPRPPRGHPAEVGLPASRVLLGGRVGTSGRLPRRPARPRERRGTGCRDCAARGHCPARAAARDHRTASASSGTPEFRSRPGSRGQPHQGRGRVRPLAGTTPRHNNAVVLLPLPRACSVPLAGAPSALQRLRRPARAAPRGAVP